MLISSISSKSLENPTDSSNPNNDGIVKFALDNVPVYKKNVVTSKRILLNNIKYKNINELLFMLHISLNILPNIFSEDIKELVQFQTNTLRSKETILKGWCCCKLIIFVEIKLISALRIIIGFSSLYLYTIINLRV